MRGSPLGTPVADDYAFLARLRFQHPLDLFDSMGASYYWRPLSRQLYFSLVGPWLLAAPWGAALLHGVLMLGTAAVLYRAARRLTTGPIACAIALLPLLAESTRVLLDWPSAGQHVLAMFLVVLAIERALAGDRFGAPLAALGALLSHEASFPVLFTLPIIAGLRTRSWGSAGRWGGLAAAVALVWVGGYAIALGHGVELPAGALPERAWGGWTRVAGLAARATLNLEDLGARVRGPLVVGYGVLGVATALLVLRRAARRAMARAIPVIGVALLWFVLGVTPLAALLPDWNAWRASLPALGLGVAITVLLASAHPALAGAFVALRLAALLAAPVVPTFVAKQPPRTVSDFSLPRLVRLQRIVDAAGRALRARHDSLPAHGVVRYWQVPRIAEVAFHGSDAVRVWYADSTLQWASFGGLAGIREPRVAVVEFDPPRSPLASAIDLDAVQLFTQAVEASLAQRFGEADSLYLVAGRKQTPLSGPFHASVARNRALIALAMGELGRADSLNRVDLELAGESASTWTMEAALALARGNADEGRRALAYALRFDPDYEPAKVLASRFPGSAP
jgi:hypothetical protein